MFGYDSFGWRIPSVVAGTVTVVVLTRLTRRLTGSTLLGLVAGLLLLAGPSLVVAGILALAAVGVTVVQRMRRAPAA